MSPDHLEKILRALNDAQARYLIVGGLAVMAHGYLRVTRDLDLVVALDGENPVRTLRVFESLGYRPNVPVALMDFTDPEKRQHWIEEKGMQVFQLVSEDLADCPVDLFAKEPIPFDELYAARADFSPVA